ncbi:MAG: class I tRNA ligase family protein, partial [Oscillospiraceae bacterium]
ILVWTTTPWTLSSNVALAVNPEIDYVEVKIKSDDQTLILAKNAIKYLGDDKLEVVRVFKGSELVGYNFETCFPDIPAQEGIEHKIVAWDDVAADEGTGVVHIAPGCGVEDFELGEKIGLAKVMPIDDTGIYLDGFGWMTGKDSHSVADEVFSHLKEANKLYKVEPHEHSYPVCWRCKAEVVYRLVPAWYIRTEEIKPKLIEASNKVQWEPASNGKRMNDWLNNMGDWNISRKRYYGMPLPFYPCECGEVTVVGSREQLRTLAVDPKMVDELPELHRPWVDKIKIKCPHCGKEIERISEIGDVWLDAGIVPFSTFGYFTDKEAWRKNFPAEWVTEMREQVRLWFYSMLFMSVTLEGVAPYERVLSYNTVIAEDGSKFSKTGFMIKFDEAAEKIGADTVRYLYAGAPIANDVRFGYNLGDEARRKMLSFWNIYTFFETYAKIDKPNFEGYKPNKAMMTPTDKWLVVRTNEFLKKATSYYDDYKTYMIIKDFEIFVDDISNWYIRTNRRRFWKTGDEQDKKLAYWVLFNSLNTCVQVMAPIIPFMTEYIWQNLTRKVMPTSELSVHLSDYPKPLEGFEDDGIIAETAISRDAIAAAMRLRNEEQIKVRQPLSKIYICCDKDAQDKIKTFEKNILDELNIKELVFLDNADALKNEYLTVNFKVAGGVLKQNVNKMKQTLENMSAEEMKALTKEVLKGGNVNIVGWSEEFNSSIFTVCSKTKDGIVSADFNNNTAVVALETTLTDELLKEGTVRDVIRQCQLIRKEAGYEVEQRVNMSISSENEFITNAISEKLDFVKLELLCDNLTLNGEIKADLQKEFDLGEDKIIIAVCKS